MKFCKRTGRDMRLKTVEELKKELDALRQRKSKSRVYKAEIEAMIKELEEK